MTYKVALDAGHGGKDPGAVGHGLNEKDVTLSVARKVKSLLEARGIGVVMTRDSDIFVDLGDRCRIANNANADIFVSIHCNAANSNAKGIETFSFRGSSSGLKLATDVQNQLLKDKTLYHANRGVKQAGFYVIKNTKMPACLVEMAFIDNAQDNQLLRNRQDDFAKGITNGILVNLGLANKPVTAPQPTPPIPQPAANSQQQFINAVKQGAIDGMKEYGILASISIAQAILESGWGKSGLATQGKNLFGVKADAKWGGAVINVPTKEWSGDKWITINANFRKYRDWNESIKDHAFFFVSTPWRKTRYAPLLASKEYKQGCIELQRSGYATDPNYGNKIKELIERYQLNKFDTIQGGVTPMPNIPNGTVEPLQVEYNGHMVTLSAINHKDENFVRIRDLEKIGLKIDWDNIRKVVVIKR